MEKLHECESFLCLSRWNVPVREGLTVIGKTDSFPSVGMLVQTKKLALRRGVWFRTLNRVERAIIDLTLQCVDCVKSVKLAKLLTAIMSKLQSAIESIVDKLVKKVGLPLARKISEIAVNWGNHLASKWAENYDFARYLAFNVDKK